MKIAVVLNDRRDREALTNGLSAPGVQLDTYATAAQFLNVLGGTRFDLVIMESKTFPGVGCPDAVIQGIATLLPESKYSENLLYWQVSLRVLEMLRAEGSDNRETPVVIRLPFLPPFSFAAGDELTRDAVESDLKDKGPVDPLHDMTADAFIEHVVRSTRARLDA